MFAQGVSPEMFVVLTLSAAMAWERVGFTRLLRRQERPEIIEHTVS